MLLCSPIFTAGMVERAIRRLQHGRSTDHTVMQSEFIIYVADTLSPFIAMLFNKALAEGLFIHKSGDPLDPSNYRTIMIVHKLAKLYGAVLEAAESNSLDYSHFISLPLAMHPDLVVQVAKFHDSVMALFRRQKNLGHGVEDSIFINPATLHLTVLMLKLWSKERVAAAVQVLQGLKSTLLKALNHRPVAVQLTGVVSPVGSEVSLV
ncbi:hypothetical protein L7F22_018220 [Adiantum nelumboides]|nr:hypothetical protein [Adiantum nelumboides]